MSDCHGLNPAYLLYNEVMSRSKERYAQQMQLNTKSSAVHLGIPLAVATSVCQLPEKEYNGIAQTTPCASSKSIVPMYTHFHKE